MPIFPFFLVPHLPYCQIVLGEVPPLPLPKFNPTPPPLPEYASAKGHFCLITSRKEALRIFFKVYHRMFIIIIFFLSFPFECKTKI